MRDEVLTPLGLHHTFLYSAEASAEGQLARGYRTTLFITHAYDAPVYAGNKAAGYIISNAEDMIRWMQIQLGLVDDIPDVFKVVVGKSHQGNQTVPEVYGQNYGGGWFVDANQMLIEHGGVNPNFSTQVTLLPDDNLGITSLGNHADINHLSLVDGIREILDGNLTPSYQMTATQISNIAMSSATIVINLLALAIILFTILNNNKEHKKRSKSRLKTVIWGIVTLILIIGTISLAGLLGYEWPVLLVWQPYSLLAVLLSLILLAGSITLFTWMSG